MTPMKALKLMKAPRTSAGIAAALAAAMIVFAGQLPTTHAAPIPAESAESAAPVKSGCDGCGVVQSMRRVRSDGDLPDLYEITVRLGGGSIQVLREANPGSWRLGERVVLFGGANP